MNERVGPIGLRHRAAAAAAPIALLACFSFAARGEPATGAAPAAGLSVVAGPCLQNLAPTSAGVVWMTDRDGMAWAEVAEAGGTSVPRRVVNSRAGLVEAQTRIHRLALDGLAPDRDYTARLVSREIRSLAAYKVDYGASVTNEIRFRTPAADPDTVSFVVFNDLHDRVPLLDRMAPIALAKPCDWIFFNGDCVADPSTPDAYGRSFLQPAARHFTSRGIPALLGRGNHETRGAGARLAERFAVTPDGRWHYAFSRGPLRVIALDAGEDKDDATPVYAGLADFDRYREEQARWLEAEMAGEAFRRATFRVILCHIPLLFPDDTKEQGRSPVNETIARLWGPILRRGRIDLWLAGHTHRAGLAPALPGTREFPLLIGGAPKEGAATLTRVTATREKLSAELLRDDGSPMECVTVNAGGAAPGT